MLICLIYITVGECRACSLRLTWSEGRRPLGAALHSSDEQGELSQWFCHDDSIVWILLLLLFFLFLFFLNFIIIIIIIANGTAAKTRTVSINLYCHMTRACEQSGSGEISAHRSVALTLSHLLL